ncbi:MAG: hypothetical protein ACR2NP_05580 [Pirellulaceae bacterium]
MIKFVPVGQNANRARLSEHAESGSDQTDEFPDRSCHKTRIDVADLRVIKQVEQLFFRGVAKAFELATDALTPDPGN